MKIATKLFIAMIVFASIASALGASHSSNIVRDALQGNISKSQSLETSQALDKIDRFLYERTLELQILTEREQIISYLQSPSSRTQANTKRLLTQFSDFRITTGVWGDMIVLDINGNVSLSTNSASDSARDISQNDFKQTFENAKNGQVSYSDVFREGDNGSPVMLFIAPVRSLSAGRPIIGYAAGELAWSTVLQILDQHGANVTAQLINKDGYILGSSDPDHNEDQILVTKISETTIFKSAEANKNNKTQSKVLPSIDNPEIETLSTYEHELGYLNYKGNGWYMFFQTPTTIAFAPADKLARSLIISSVVITLMTLVGLSLYGYRSIIKPVKTLRAAMFRIIGGDRTSRVHVSSHDEISELGLAFNKMSEGLEESEKLLREGEARLKASINSLEIGFFMTDLNDDIVIINKSASALLLTFPGRPLVKSWSFKNIADILTGSVDLRAIVKACKDTGHVIKIKEVNFNYKVLSLFAGPILSHAEDNKSEVIGTVILIEDVTEVIVQARSKDEFFSIASHELRTPLTSIRGNSSMILELYAEVLKDESLKEMISDIHDSSTRLIEIVNDFLDVSRIEQGKMKFTLSEVKLDKVIEKIVYDMKVVLREKQLSLDIEHKTLDVLPAVLADSDRVKQVVYNLIGNAIKFTEKGGVKVSATLEDKMVKVVVTDTGRGVSKEGQKMLFRKFQQAGNSLLTRDTTKGTGLGLYISKLLVEGMGGKIALENSAVGVGTTISFTLPIASKVALSDLQAQTEKQRKKVDVDTGLTKS